MHLNLGFDFTTVALLGGPARAAETPQEKQALVTTVAPEPVAPELGPVVPMPNKRVAFAKLRSMLRALLQQRAAAALSNTPIAALDTNGN